MINNQILSLESQIYNSSHSLQSLQSIFKTISALHQALIPFGYVKLPLPVYEEIKRRVKKLLGMWNLGEVERFRMVNTLGMTRNSKYKP